MIVLGAMTQGSASNLLWLVSRAAGVIALVMVSLTVVLGLSMAGKVLRDPGRRRTAVSLHEDFALIGLVSLAIHGVTLLGDTWLHPGLAGITVPFAIAYRPAFTGLGIIGGYLAMLLGLSFYLRRRIGAKRWRSLHRLTVVIWPLAAVHTLGAGTDGAHLWLRVVVLLPLPALAYLMIVRIFSGRTLPSAKSSRETTPRTPAPRTPAPRTPAPRTPAGSSLTRFPGRLEADSGARSA